MDSLNDKSFPDSDFLIACRYPFIGPSVENISENSKDVNLRKSHVGVFWESSSNESSSEEEIIVCGLEELKVSSVSHKITYMKRKLDAPIFLTFSSKELEEKSVHRSFRFRPKNYIHVEIELFFYSSKFCKPKAFYGNLSSRKPDLILSKVLGDIPPLCFCSILESILSNDGNLVCFSYVVNCGHTYNLWFDKSSNISVIKEKLEYSLLPFPMSYGYMAFLKGSSKIAFFEDYSRRVYLNLKRSTCRLPLLLVEVDS